MRRLLILTTTLLAVALLTACGGDDTTGGDDENTGPGSIFGTYTLMTINGEELPVTFVIMDTEFVFTAGELRLNSDNTYTMSVTVRTDGTTETTDASGACTVDGSTIEFDDGSTGTVSGNTLTVSDAVTVMVFRK